MNRKWNLPIVFGFLVTMGAFVSYYTIFVKFPVTRDFPWLNLMMFAGGLGLLGAGLKRAFRDPGRFRGKIRRNSPGHPRPDRIHRFSGLQFLPFGAASFLRRRPQGLDQSSRFHPA